MSTLRTIAALCVAVLIGVPANAATVDGMNVHWTSSGSGAQALILVHGWTCDETSWQGQVPELSKRFRVITLDLPGHGKSDSPKDGTFTMALFARAVEAVRAEAKVERAVFAGHSMGTPVVRQYAVMYPQRVAGLVLVDGLVQFAGTAAFTPPAMTGEAGLKARETMVRGMFGPATTPALQEHILRMMMGTKEATAAGAMAGTWDTSELSNDPIRVPTLAVYADGRPLATEENIKRVFPAAEYHRMAGTAHFLMMEKPAEFNRLVTDFVGRLKY